MSEFLTQEKKEWVRSANEQIERMALAEGDRHTAEAARDVLALLDENRHLLWVLAASRQQVDEQDATLDQIRQLLTPLVELEKEATYGVEGIRNAEFIAAARTILPQLIDLLGLEAEK